MNTTDGEARELLPQWLVEQGVAPRAAALERAREVREAIRELLIANNEGGVAPEASRGVLESAALQAKLTLSFGSTDSAELVPQATGVVGAMGSLLAIVFRAMEDGSWARLKACRNCHWAFYDYSRNRSAAWCSMQLCGNRLKTRAYRRRRKTRPRRSGARRGAARHGAARHGPPA